MDANQYAQEVQPASKSLGIVIRSAEWMGQGKAPERQLDIAIPLAEQGVQVEENIPALAAQSVEPEVLPPAEAQPPAPENTIEAEENEREINLPSVIASIVFVD